MASGQRVGALAQTLFPGGIDCSPVSHFDFTASFKKTRKLVDLCMPVLYEAAFEASGVMVAVDVLALSPPAGGAAGEWHMYEVKSSTKVKPEHITDAALQCHILQQSGLELASVNIIHVDRTYTRPDSGPVNVQQLFKVVDISQEVAALQSTLPGQIQELQHMVAASEVPEVTIGPHCSSPYSCKFQTHCFSQHRPAVPAKYSVLDLKYGPGRKQWDLLLRQGVSSTLQIPSDYALSPAQHAQVACDQRESQQESQQDNESDRVEKAHGVGGVFDRERVDEFLATLRYPLAFLVSKRERERARPLALLPWRSPPSRCLASCVYVYHSYVSCASSG